MPFDHVHYAILCELILCRLIISNTSIALSDEVEGEANTSKMMSPEIREMAAHRIAVKDPLGPKLKDPSVQSTITMQNNVGAILPINKNANNYSI